MLAIVTSRLLTNSLPKAFSNAPTSDPSDLLT